MIAVLGLVLLGVASAQQLGTVKKEIHPALAVESCTRAGGCTSEAGFITMDMQWRWMHNVAGYNNCLDQATKTWDKALCPDPATCAKNCALEGADAASYADAFTTAIDKGIKLRWPKAPRVYLLDGSAKTYKMFKLKNRELSVDIDFSKLPCGANANVYLVEMAADGGANAHNLAGAAYGTGYCDAQCPHMNFINGLANTEGWATHQERNPDGKDVAVGPEGIRGHCCAEMDIIEGNSAAGAYTAHPCSTPKQQVCQGDGQCGTKAPGTPGYCDKNGCGNAPYRMGDEKFWGVGQGYAVDTSKPMTVVTQFVTSDGTDAGDLVEVRRFYLQEGKVVRDPAPSVLKADGDSLTDSFCAATSQAFSSAGNTFRDKGGLKAMGQALDRGMVLTMSVWDDDVGRMLWLDGVKTDVQERPDAPGVKRGPCDFHFGTHKDLLHYEKTKGAMEVSISNIRYGDIGSTRSEIAAAAILP